MFASEFNSVNFSLVEINQPNSQLLIENYEVNVLLIHLKKKFCLSKFNKKRFIVRKHPL